MPTPTYAARADVLFYAGGEVRLVQLTDTDSNGIEDPLIVDDAICRAEDFVNSYFRQAFETPVSNPTGAIRQVTAGYAVYLLKLARDALSDKDELVQEQRVEWLKGVADGKIDPGVNPANDPSPKNQPRHTTRDSSQKKVSRENLDGFA